MGQFPSEEEARLKEIDKQLSEAHRRARELWPAVKAERTAGIPPENSGKQAIYMAAHRHVLQLTDEAGVLTERWFALREGGPIPRMPPPTPLWEEVVAGLSKVEPARLRAAAAWFQNSAAAAVTRQQPQLARFTSARRRGCCHRELARQRPACDCGQAKEEHHPGMNTDLE
ncbi:hypothetical protein ABPG77_003123 [Micractinium sp. CCAP 211/92]